MTTETELLKSILENIHHPERLDEHPWVSRCFVTDAVQRNQALQGERPGRQLVAALADLFPRTMPSVPPRRGKRLDTRWGEFGLLAALYFAPLRLGLPAPSSLRDAWGRIDQAILLYAYGKGADLLSEKEIETYRLVRHELEVAATSTLSDWHCKGIQKLVDAIPLHEKHLEISSARGPLALPPKVVLEEPVRQTRPALLLLRKILLPLLLLTVVIAVGLGGYKARQIYRAAMPLREDLSQLQALRPAKMDMKALMKAGPLLAKSRRDFAVLSQEVEPVLWLGDWFGWVPVYGGDMRASRDLLKLADLLLDSSERTYLAFQPLLTALDQQSQPDPAQMVLLLNKAQPELKQARQTFDQVLSLRAGLNVQGFSPQVRSLIEQKLDPMLPLMDDGLAVGTAVPGLLGAASEGPRTYMLLAQNEDELRPTGGFITAVGTLVVQNGQVLHVNFVDSGDVDNWDYPYPQAPWQLEQYMNSPVLILRDANWFPDFPTSALYAESLYAYRYSHSVDGVIAFDQHLLVSLLEATGPVEVEGESTPIDSGNVVAFMRSAKTTPVDRPLPAGWSRKGFMDRITKALLVKIFVGKDISWEKMGSVLFQDLEQDHLLLQVDDPTLTPVLARRGWDGALHYEGGDFLMAVDANIGFNKTNAVVDTRLTYDVDLSDLTQPAATLTVTHHNNALADVSCLQWRVERPPGEKDYPIDACYWNYMRIYVPAGSELLEATPQHVPDEWMTWSNGVDAPVDLLDEEISGLQAFGTLMAVPGNGSQLDRFQYRLPANVLSMEGDQYHYRLHVEKQPGTLAIPLTLRIHLPQHAVLKSSSLQASLQDGDLLIETDLRTDADLELVFSLP
jgi:hypothetical protein